MKKTIAIILAGGKGERLWPLSRKSLPKQLLPLENNSSLLKNTVNRLHTLVEKEDIWIITTQEQQEQIKQHVGDLVGTILAEPGARNTGPAILYTCLKIQEQHPDATAIFLPADHVISPTDVFINNIQQAISYAQKHNTISLLGLKPTYPAPGLGHIEYNIDTDAQGSTLHPVKKFHEKPSLERAIQYNKNPHMLWNIGIFTGTIQTFLNEFKTHAPHVLQQMNNHLDNKCSYNEIESISIDYAIMEKSTKIHVLPVSFSWSDVGNLDTFLTIGKKTSTHNIVSIKSSNNIIQADDKLVALIDVDDLCIVHTDDVLLVAKRDNVEKVKLILKELQEDDKEQYL